MPSNDPATQSTLADVSKLSEVLNTGLSKEALGIIYDLLEKGVSPVALAEVVKQLREEE